MLKDVLLRLLEPQDFEALALFLEKMMQGEVPAAIWRDRFRLWWEINPVFTPGTPRGWLLCDSTGAIGGFIGNIATNYLIDGQIKVVYSATSWYVAEDFRGASLQLIRAFRKQNAPLLDTTPSGHVVTILSKLGFKNLAQPWIKRDGIYPLNRQLFRRSVAAKLVRKFPKAIAEVIAFGASFLAKLRQDFGLFGLTNGNFIVEEISEFDADCTVLWNKLSKAYKISVVRNRQTMNWFFFGSETLKLRRLILALKKAGELKGYIAFKIHKSRLGVKDYVYLELVDIWIPRLTLKQYKNLFRAIFVFLRTQHKEIVSLNINAFNPEMSRALNQAGIFWTKGRAQFLYDKFPLIKGDDYFATPLDGDRCYFP